MYPTRYSLVAWTLATVSATTAQVGPRRLNESLLQPTQVELLEARLTPDGQALVFRADLLTDDRPELFRVASDGSGGTRLLSGASGAGIGSVSSFEVTADGARVVYRGDLLQELRFELFSVRLDGSGGVRLNTPIAPAEGSLDAFRLNASGSHVLYVADARVFGRRELYLAPADGSSPAVRVSPTPVPGGDVELTDFLLSADGQRIAYLADQSVNDVVELYGVVAGVVRKLNPSLVTGGDVGGSLSSRRVALAQGDMRAVYLADALVDERLELFSVPLDGSSPAQQLSAPLAPGNRVFSFRITPDGTRAVYLTTNSGLFVVPVDGSLPAQNIGGAPHDLRFDLWGIDPTSTHLAYVRQRAPSSLELLSVPLTGGPNLRLDPAQVSGTVHDFRFDPAGGQVAFRVALTSSAPTQVAVVPLDRSRPAVLLDAPAHPGSSASEYEFAGERLAFVADAFVDERHELFSAPLDGSDAPVRLSGPLVPEGNVIDLESSSDGNLVVYRADQATDGVYEYFGVPSAGGGWFPINEPLPPGPSVVEVREHGFSAPARRVVYKTFDESNSRHEVFSAPLDGPPGAVHLGAGLDWCLTVDGLSVVRGGGNLYVGPIDGSTPSRFLGEVLYYGGGGPPFDLSLLPTPDGRFVLFRPRLSRIGPLPPEKQPLWAVPLDGSSAPWRISRGGVSDFAPASASTVVFPDLGELHVRPVDASRPSLRLDGPSVVGGEVSAFLLAARGRVAVYLADARVVGQRELFSVPTDGSCSPLRLSAPVTGSGVWRFALGSDGFTLAWEQETPQGTRLLTRRIGGAEPRLLATTGAYFEQLFVRAGHVVYTDGSTFRSLLSVPLSGGPARTLVSGPVETLAFSPDERQVATRTQDEALWCAPVDGHEAARMLLPASWQVEEFAFAPDSFHLLALARRTPGTTELFLVARDGRDAPRRVGPAPVAGGSVSGFSFERAPEPWILWRGALLVADLRELFGMPWHLAQSSATPP